MLIQIFLQIHVYKHIRAYQVFALAPCNGSNVYSYLAKITTVELYTSSLLLSKTFMLRSLSHLNCDFLLY